MNYEAQTHGIIIEWIFLTIVLFIIAYNMKKAQRQNNFHKFSSRITFNKSYSKEDYK